MFSTVKTAPMSECLSVYPVCNAPGFVCGLRMIIHHPRSYLQAVGGSNHPIQFKTFLPFHSFHYLFLYTIAKQAKHEPPLKQKMALGLGTEQKNLILRFVFKSLNHQNLWDPYLLWSLFTYYVHIVDHQPVTKSFDSGGGGLLLLPAQYPFLLHLVTHAFPLKN